MALSRKTFLGGLGAAACAPFLGGCARRARTAADAAAGGVSDETLPPWRPGELELHFIHTGRGENCFFRLPDGTTILNDVGDFFRPRWVANGDLPLLPDDKRLGGDWVGAYLTRIGCPRVIDYLIFSHWHIDHVGHARYGAKEDPERAYRFRVTDDGRRLNGFLCVAEEFAFARYFDREWPARGTWAGTRKDCHPAVDAWLKPRLASGETVAEAFRVGARNQIALLHDPARHAGDFETRNLCASGKLWDGADGFRDFAAEHAAAGGKTVLDENLLSLGFSIRYGDFTFFTAGDAYGKVRAPGGRPEAFPAPARRPDGRLNYEALLGLRAGRASLCKMGHHGCCGAMAPAFVEAVRANAYVCSMWDSRQCDDFALKSILDTHAKHGEKPLILPNVAPASRLAAAARGEGLMDRADVRAPAHIVVKVPPGGRTFTTYLLDAADPALRLRILRSYTRPSV